MKLRVAGAQLAVTDDIAANLAAIEQAIDYAQAEGAEILLTPEGSLSGYTPHFEAQAVRSGLAHVTEYARVRGVGLALGTCAVEADGRTYDQLRFYRPDGAYLGFHSKILTCGTLEDPPHGEIEQYAVAPLRTFDWGGLTVGGLICNDLWANPACTPGPDPHLSQRLAEVGARVIFHAVNGGRSGDAWSELVWQFHEANLRMRARAGHLWIVTVDSAYPPSLPCSAPSGVIAPDGAWACRASAQGEQIFTCTLDIDAPERRGQHNRPSRQRGRGATR
jgi:predicted amidohydrolase